MSAPKPREDRADPRTFTPAPQRMANVLIRLRALTDRVENHHTAKMDDLLKPHLAGTCGHHDRKGRWYECMACLYAWAYYATRQPTQHGLERSRSSTRPRPTETTVVVKLNQRAAVREAAVAIVDSWRLASEGRWKPSFQALQSAETLLIKGPGRGRMKDAPVSRLEVGDKLPEHITTELHAKKSERQTRGEDYGETPLPRESSG